MEHIAQTFTGTVEIDGETFVDCVFDDATLVYSGGERPVISGCSFRSTGLVFRGAAAATMGMLTALAQPGSGLRSNVAKTFLDILNAPSAPAGTSSAGPAPAKELRGAGLA